ncbi:MAG: beta-glucosidase [Chloroflexi bacterium]|nr:beta-glucosidase [Chloroflexota bacterium]
MRWFTFLLACTLLLTLAAPFRAAPVRSQDDNPPYLNPDLPVEERVEDLLARMTLEEKVGQMTQVEKNSINPDDIGPLGIGSLLSGGGGYPTPNDAENWYQMVYEFQNEALNSRLGIPLIYGVDAVHGHNNVVGATIFPHQIGLGATHNPALLEQIGQVVGQEMLATGIPWNFAPVLAVVQDLRWGRTYESYGQDPALVSELAAAYIRGQQSVGVYVSAKHFVGDGGTVWGTSTTGNYMLDQGVTEADEETLRAIHLAPYQAALDAGARIVMISFSSWGGMKMHAQSYLINDVLKGEMGFTGFTVSDWAGMDQISSNYYEAMVTGINAGVDMNMVPYDYHRFINAVLDAVDNGDITEARIDEAVRRILRVKFEMGLFENPFGDDTLLADVGSDAHRELARQAVRESLVLLQNENTALPISKEATHIFVSGMQADNIGLQCGGWTIEWQGRAGAITEGTTILEGIEAAASENSTVTYSPAGNFDDVTDDAGNPIKAEYGIVVVGEAPYAEGLGDVENPALARNHRTLIEKMRERADKVIVVLVSGRPLLITDVLDQADAWVAAWLPGTEGQGVADVLFGDYQFTGRLSFAWPRNLDQIPYDALLADAEGPLFPMGFGLEQ